MPVPALASLAKEAGKSLSDAERYYDDAKDQRMKDTGKSDSALDDDDYKYIMGVVKKRLGLKVQPAESYRRSTVKTAKELIEAAVNEAASMSDITTTHNKILIAIDALHLAIVNHLKVLVKANAQSGNKAHDLTHDMLATIADMRNKFERGPKPPNDQSYKFMDIRK